MDSDADFAKILSDFKKVASEIPHEKIRNGVLRKHDLIADQFDTLPTAAKDAINREVQEAIQQAVLRKQQDASNGAPSKPVPDRRLA